MDITLDKATTWRLELMAEFAGQRVEVVAARGLEQWLAQYALQFAERLGGEAPAAATLANGKTRVRRKQNWRKKRDHRNLSVKELNALVAAIERTPTASFVAHGKMHCVSAALARTLAVGDHAQQAAGKVSKISAAAKKKLPTRV